MKASLPGAEQPVLFRARRPSNSQPVNVQQTYVMPDLIEPRNVCAMANSFEGFVPTPVSELSFLPGERRHSYLKTRWFVQFGPIKRYTYIYTYIFFSINRYI